MRNIVAISSVCVLFFSIVMATDVSGDEDKPHRGEFPKCQVSCLAEHTKNIEKLVAAYEADRGKFSFQDSVDSAVSKYRVCIDNCRYLLPVK